MEIMCGVMKDSEVREMDTHDPGPPVTVGLVDLSLLGQSHELPSIQRQTIFRRSSLVKQQQGPVDEEAVETVYRTQSVGGRRRNSSLKDNRNGCGNAAVKINNDEVVECDTHTALQMMGSKNTHREESVRTVESREKKAVPSVMQSIPRSVFGDGCKGKWCQGLVSAPVTPWNVNRMWLVPLYMFLAFNLGCIYWGWSGGFKEMLILNGAYVDVCQHELSESAIKFAKEKGGLDLAVHGYDAIFVFLREMGEYNCADQARRTSRLLTISAAAQLGSGVLSGLSLDFVGPLWTSLIGIFLKAAGILFIGFAAIGTPSPLYVPGFMLIGASTDLSFIPLLLLKNLFPGNEGLILALLGSAMSASSAVPIILQIIWHSIYHVISLKTLLLLYVGVIFSICLIFTVIFVPRHKFECCHLLVDEPAEFAGLGLQTPHDHTICDAVASPPDQTDPKDVKKATPFDAPSSSRSNCYDTYSPQSHSSRFISTHLSLDVDTEMPPTACPISLQDIDRGDCGIIVSHATTTTNYRTRPSAASLIYKPHRFFHSQLSSLRLELIDFFPHMIKPNFLLILPFFCFLILRSEFIQKSADIQIPVAYNAWVTLSPLKFLPCIFMGLINDWIGIYWTLFIINALGILIFSFAIADHPVCDYIVLILMFFMCSWVFTSLYTYLTVTQNDRHFGKLSGVASLLAGGFVYLSLLLYNISIGDGNTFLLSNLIMIGLGIISGVNVYYTWTFSKKGNESVFPPAAVVEYDEKHCMNNDSAYLTASGCVTMVD